MLGGQPFSDCHACHLARHHHRSLQSWQPMAAAAGLTQAQTSGPTCLPCISPAAARADSSAGHATVLFLCFQSPQQSQHLQGWACPHGARVHEGVQGSQSRLGTIEAARGRQQAVVQLPPQPRPRILALPQQHACAGGPHLACPGLQESPTGVPSVSIGVLLAGSSVRLEHHLAWRLNREAGPSARFGGFSSSIAAHMCGGGHTWPAQASSKALRNSEHKGPGSRIKFVTVHKGNGEGSGSRGWGLRLRSRDFCGSTPAHLCPHLACSGFKQGPASSRFQL